MTRGGGGERCFSVDREEAKRRRRKEKGGERRGGRKVRRTKEDADESGK